MNNSNINTRVYAQKVELLLRLMPIVMEEGVFAVHGGTAINLFIKDLPRYSVDIDLTYIPLADRHKSLEDINLHLTSISEKAKKAFMGIHIVTNYATSKLLCEYRGKFKSVSNSSSLNNNEANIAKPTSFLSHNSMEEKSRQHFLANIHVICLT